VERHGPNVAVAFGLTIPAASVPLFRASITLVTA